MAETATVPRPGKAEHSTSAEPPRPVSAEAAKPKDPAAVHAAKPNEGAEQVEEDGSLRSSDGSTRGTDERRDQKCTTQ